MFIMITDACPGLGAHPACLAVTKYRNWFAMVHHGWRDGRVKMGLVRRRYFARMMTMTIQYKKTLLDSSIEEMQLMTMVGKECGMFVVPYKYLLL